MSDIKVRKATQEDTYDLLGLVKKFYKEGEYSFLKFDNEYVLNQIRTHLNLESNLCLVVEYENELVGFFFGVLGHTFFSQQKVATEVSWYVLKEHRRKNVGRPLLEEYFKWVENNDVVMSNLCYIVGIEEEDFLKKYYTEKGYFEKEVTYIKVH